MSYRKTLIASAVLTGLMSGHAAAASNDWKGESKDAWIDGKVETALMLNTELNNFEIDTHVENREVTLSGTVDSDIAKQLAGEITGNVKGVKEVSNDLVVEGGYRDKAQQVGNKMERAGDKFVQTWYDSTTTAGLNMQFAMNDNLQATRIDVDTKNGVVTLRGEVESDAARDLAVEMAKSYDNVDDVKDQLSVK